MSLFFDLLSSISSGSSPLTTFQTPGNFTYYPEKTTRETVFIDPTLTESILDFSTVTDYLTTQETFNSGNTPTKSLSAGDINIVTSGNTSQYYELGTVNNIYKAVTIELDGTAVSSGGTFYEVGIGIRRGTNLFSFVYDFASGVGKNIDIISGTITKRSTIYGINGLTGTISKIHVLFGCLGGYIYLQNTSGTIFYYGYNARMYDWTTTANQALGHKFELIVNTDSTSGTVKIKKITYGYAGLTGFCNPRIVMCQDGRPYIKNNKVYFTASTGLGGGTTDIWADMANSVFTMDLTSHTYARVGIILCRREGSLQLDGVSHLILDEINNNWRLVTHTMSSAVTTLAQGTFSTNPLSGVHIIDTARLSGISGTGYDPSVIYLNNKWYVAYTRSNTGTSRTTVFTTTDFVTFTEIWTDTTGAFEGLTICKIGNIVYAFAAAIGSSAMRVYNLTTGAIVYNFTNPSGFSYANGHFALFPESRSTTKKTNFHLITHFGDFQYGDYNFGSYKAYSVPQTEDGYEYPIKPYLM